MATFKDGQGLATELTEKEMVPLWAATISAYRGAQKKISTDLAVVYSKYLETADPGDYYTIMLQYDRQKRLLARVTKYYGEASYTAGRNIVNSSGVAFSNTFYREQYTLIYFDSGNKLKYKPLNHQIFEYSTLGTDESWKRIQSEAVKKMYGDPRNYTPPGGSLTDLLTRNRRNELDAIKQAITTGLQQGTSYTKMTKEITNIIGKELIKDGKLTYTGAKARAANIVRTEGTRNLNGGFNAMLHNAEGQGVSMFKQWMASLDARTRPTHGSADGQKVPLSGNFRVGGATGPYPGAMSSGKENYRCRCSHVGVNEDMPLELRRGRNPVTGKTDIFSYKYFNTWAKENGLKRNKYGMLL